MSSIIFRSFRAMLDSSKVKLGIVYYCSRFGTTRCGLSELTLPTQSIEHFFALSTASRAVFVLKELRHNNLRNRGKLAFTNRISKTVQSRSNPFNPSPYRQTPSLRVSCAVSNARLRTRTRLPETL